MTKIVTSILWHPTLIYFTSVCLHTETGNGFYISFKISKYHYRLTVWIRTQLLQERQKWDSQTTFFSGFNGRHNRVFLTPKNKNLISLFQCEQSERVHQTIDKMPFFRLITVVHSTDSYTRTMIFSSIHFWMFF